MIEIDGLTKRFGHLTAVDNLTLSVAKGDVLGFLGPNGSGKTTTMRMVTGYLPITSGSATVCGYNVASDPIAIKEHIGYLPEGAPLYGDMTPAGLLSFVAEIRGYRGAEIKKRVATAVEKLKIESVFNRPIDTLSKGYKRRVGFAQAILHDPDILILDEPTDGLDPNQKHEVRSLIDEMAAEKVIIISTHILEEVTAVCNRAAIISSGKLVFNDTPQVLLSKAPTHNAVTLHLTSAKAADLKSGLEALPKVAKVELPDGPLHALVIPVDGASIVDEVSAYVRDKKVDVDQLFVERGELDDVFRQLTVQN